MGEIYQFSTHHGVLDKHECMSMKIMCFSCTFTCHGKLITTPFGRMNKRTSELFRQKVEIDDSPRVNGVDLPNRHSFFSSHFAFFFPDIEFSIDKTILRSCMPNDKKICILCI